MQQLHLILIFYILLTWHSATTTAITTAVTSTRAQAQPHFVEFYADYKRHHIEDELHYSFRYFIDAAASNVHLDHSEERRGKQVTGHYGLLEPGGYVRDVYYEVDGDKGFRAVVNTRSAVSRTHQRLQLSGAQPRVPIRHKEPVAFVV